MKKLLLLFLLILNSPLTSQVSEQWAARYNGASNLNDGGISIVVSNDGSVYVAGITTVTAVDLDYILIKYSQEGQEIWNRSYNGPGNSIDQAISVAVDNDGNVIITGSSRSSQNEGSEDIATLKYSPEGDLLWTARYNGPDDKTDAPVKIKTDAAGNIYIAGNSISTNAGKDVITIKYNAAGQEQWVYRYNNSQNTDDNAFLMVTDQSSNIYITGWVFLNNTLDFLTLKINSDGVMQWVKSYNGPTNYEDKSYSVTVGNNGSVYVSGCSQGIGTGIYDYATIKYSSSGEQMWVSRYNGIENGHDIANTVTMDSEGFIYVAGVSEGKGTGKDIALVKYDTAGNEVWVSRYNSPFNNDEEAYVAATDDLNNIYIIGFSYTDPINPDYITLKYNNSGQLQWDMRYDGPPSQFDNAISIFVFNSDVFVTGLSSGIGSGFDIATIKYDQITSVHPVSSIIPSEYKLDQNYPNPFNPATNIGFKIPKAGFVTLKVYDISGKNIGTPVSENLHPGIYSVNFITGKLSSGIYFYTLTAGSFTETKRMLLVK
jgi:uncharacterized delta-60 repeat protein